MKELRLSLLLLTLPILLSGQKAIMDIHVMMVSSGDEALYKNASTFGGGIAYDFYLNNFISLGIEGDYLGFRYTEGDSAVNIIPVHGILNGHWNVTDNFDVYGGAGIGFFWQRYKNGFSLSESSLVWGLSPRVGLNYEFAENLFLTSSLKYTYTFDEPVADDANGLLIFSIGLGYNINAEF